MNIPLVDFRLRLKCIPKCIVAPVPAGECFLIGVDGHSLAAGEMQLPYFGRDNGGLQDHHDGRHSLKLSMQEDGSKVRTV